MSSFHTRLLRLENRAGDNDQRDTRDWIQEQIQDFFAQPLEVQKAASRQFHDRLSREYEEHYATSEYGPTITED